ncbi:putative disease resistance protein RGA4 [Populus alba]|uniref:putative disease resistance protein RGA4 n=1 Tax=Populus alba TaxID=43335 RepID=UPI00158BC50D|nr:putative disease resistance protein RGA3 [Populus alba]XP_034896099.1 putative disease resistance protein RGA3 [Populus alba]XP_034896100.1 putative disease resistance protein RGA3 [Populus alba]XP_034896101.1 putative disease resistance protein RGA3 [Populus alba]
MAERVLFNIAEEIVKKLGPLATQEIALWWGVKDQLSKLMSTVTRIKGVLHDAEEQVQKPPAQLEDWLGKLQEAVYDAEDLLDDFSTEVQRKRLRSRNKIPREVRTFFSGSNQLVYGWQMGHKVKELRQRLDEIVSESEKFHFEVRYEENASLTMIREATTSSEPEIFFGREDEKKKVMSFLLNPNDEIVSVSVISIVGMGGLGKTTFAQSVFNDEQVNHHFGLKLWVRVSGCFDVKKILKDVSDELESMKKKLKEKIEEKKIENRKYLLVLDDVWDNKDGRDGEKWDCLRQSLPHEEARGNKMIITTRSDAIAKLTSRLSLALKGLSEKESWSLFSNKAFGSGQESNYIDEKIKKEIVERCQGVPLVIKAIARLMSLKDRAQWLPFIKQELPHRVKDDNIIHTLKLSYDPLPSYLKHCFAYCSLFPKGHRIDVKSLIRLWIAQGFISSSNLGECLEIVGFRCFENLLWRSFFHEVEKDDLGSITSCKMHDLATHVAGFQSIKVEGGGNRICDLTRHVSFDTEFDLSLPCAKRLRTLVLLQGGKWDEGAWESICRDFRRLRVLVLSDFGMKEVSPLIEKIKHLKYLDLSNNEIEALSNSVTSLVNLQVLKLNGCRKLKELPRDISKLINLRHLDVGCTLDDDLCEDLEYMPRGIGKLTSLQTLSCFVVAKKSSSKSEIIGGLDELRRLNELRGRLEIIVKGCDGGSCLSEFEGAKLIDKEYLQSLTVWWDPKLDSDSDIDLYDKMLQSLRPNSNLQGLIVGVYGGMRFPSWVSHLSNLASIVLVDCGRLKHIPPLDGIPSLEELRIVRLGDLEYIDSEGVGGKGASMFFPSLKTLDIEDCFRLKGWRKRWSRDEMNDDSDESTIEEGLIMLSFPRLSSLSIDECPNLTSMPLFPTLDEDLNLWRTSSMPLQQTMKMTSPVSSSSFIRPLSKLKRLDMLFIDDMESLPEVGLQNLSSLQSLSIRGCSRLKSLPLPDKGMHSLQKLEVVGCRELKSLSESQEMIPYLPSLQALSIEDCSEELSGRGKER